MTAKTAEICQKRVVARQKRIKTGKNVGVELVSANFSFEITLIYLSARRFI